ncbi:hypothetical protein GCM10009600_04280 [Oerskovia paurometabola]
MSHAVRSATTSTSRPHEAANTVASPADTAPATPSAHALDDTDEPAETEDGAATATLAGTTPTASTTDNPHATPPRTRTRTRNTEDAEEPGDPGDTDEADRAERAKRTPKKDDETTGHRSVSHAPITSDRHKTETLTPCGRAPGRHSANSQPAVVAGP